MKFSEYIKKKKNDIVCLVILCHAKNYNTCMKYSECNKDEMLCIRFARTLI